MPEDLNKSNKLGNRLKSSKSKKQEKVSENSNETQDCDYEPEEYYSPSVLGSEIDTEVDPVEHEVNYKIQSVQSQSLRELNEFLKDPKCINANADPTTNFIDRLFGKCYKIADKKISKFFKLVEACRRDKHILMLAERQQEYSGIMLDFDIYQDTEDDQIDDQILNILCQKVVSLLMKLLVFHEKKPVIYIGITRRPRITYSDDKECYKDGFHLIIPGIKIRRGAKRLLLNKLIDNELIDQILCDVQPASIKTKNGDYQRKDFLDVNSAHVPVFMVGSSTKKGNPPYQLTHVFEVFANTENKNIVPTKSDKFLRDKSINLSYEFSLNYEANDSIIKKQNYELNDKYVTDASDLENKNKNSDEEQIRNFGMMSLNSIHDAQIKEIKDLLDVLAPYRSVDYEPWFDVLCVLANTSTSYKDLAEYFSRKSKKFNMSSFEHHWLNITKGVGRGKKPLTIGSLHYWAKIDNPDRYKQIRDNTVFSVLYNMVYEGYKEGSLSHADIAKILHQLLQHKYVTDIPEGEKTSSWYEFILDDDDYIDGELYKWHRWKSIPVSLSKYISEVLPNVFNGVFKKVKDKYDKSAGDESKYFNIVLRNFKATMRKLGDRTFKKNIILEAEDRFNKRGFTESLDQDPLARGVQNGVLKLSLAPSGKPMLIQGYHSYPVSKHTKVPYIPFNPYDPITKKILVALRNLFPDNEPDSFEFTMTFLSSTIDGNPKESMFMIVVGKGANGKTFLIELHRGAIGSHYSVKLPLSSLTGKTSNADNATPAVMMLKDASLATYSESNKHEVLNAASIKEKTGLETLAGRKLHQDMVNFKPRCHHLVTTNYDFDIECNDYGTWRRIQYNPLKITFINPNIAKHDPNDPYQRIADTSVTEKWTEDPEIQGRYLGFMVWCHYWLYHKYNGSVLSVPHPHIQFETMKYERRQNTIAAFLAQRFVKTSDEKAQFPMPEEVQKYTKWYQLNHGGVLPAKGITEQFQNSIINKYIKATSRGLFLVGHRFLDNNEQLGDGEEYGMKNVFDIAIPDDNFGIKSETPDDYYSRICKEYDSYKHIFDNKPTYNIAVDLIKEDFSESKITANVTRKNNLMDAVELNGKILPSGIVLRAMEEPEPSINYLTDNYMDLGCSLPDIGDVLDD